MAYRNEVVTVFKNIVICDDCKTESLLEETIDAPMSFDRRMNETLARGWTFKNENGVFKNYCHTCKTRRKQNESI